MTCGMLSKGLQFFLELRTENVPCIASLDSSGTVILDDKVVKLYGRKRKRRPKNVSVRYLSESDIKSTIGSLINRIMRIGRSMIWRRRGGSSYENPIALFM